MIPPPLARLRLILALGLLTPGLVAGGEKLLGAPVYDHATEATYRRVSWADFKGNGVAPPGWNRWQVGSYAHIATSIYVGRFEVKVGEQDGAWTAVPVGIRPYAVMNKDFSAVKPGSRNAATLAHEQLHFDLAELTARRIAVRLIPLAGRGASAQEAGEDLAAQISQIHEAGLAEAGELQRRYDRETSNGTRRKKQKQWAQAVPEMFRQASEALSAALEAGAPEPDPPDRLLGSAPPT